MCKGYFFLNSDTGIYFSTTPHSIHVDEAHLNSVFSVSGDRGPFHVCVMAILFITIDVIDNRTAGLFLFKTRTDHYVNTFLLAVNVYAQLTFVMPCRSQFMLSDPVTDLSEMAHLVVGI